MCECWSISRAKGRGGGGGEVGGAALVGAEQGPSPPDDILRNTIKDLWHFIEKG